MSDIVKLSDHQKPVSYTIDVMHHHSGSVEIFVRDVSDDDRSVNSVIAFIIKWASQHMTERNIHVAMLERIDQLMDAQKDTPEAKELSALASACAAYEREAFPNMLAQDSVAEQKILQGQYDVYAAAREEYRKKITEQADEIDRLRADWETARDAHDRRTAEVVRLRSALRFYADQNNYEGRGDIWGDGPVYPPLVFEDKGGRARAALGEKETCDE